jgi:hypothetical protein
MALNATTLGNQLYTAANSFDNIQIDPADLETQRQAYWNAIAAAIVAHITANAQVLPTLLVSAAPGSPVVGTGTIV